MAPVSSFAITLTSFFATSYGWWLAGRHMGIRECHREVSLPHRRLVAHSHSSSGSHFHGGAESTFDLPRSVLPLRFENRSIYLVGVIHGTSTAADDVTRVVGALRPRGVVLELCRTRFQDLTRSGLPDVLPEGAISETGTKGTDKPREVLSRSSFRGSLAGWVSGVASVFANGGLAQAFLAGLLSAGNILQPRLSPGSEFRAAILAARALSENPTSLEACADEGSVLGCDVFLGDREVSETLRRAAQAPWMDVANQDRRKGSKRLISGGTLPNDVSSFGYNALVLVQAILGSGPGSHLDPEVSLSLPKLLMQDPRWASDAMSILFPAITLAALLVGTESIALDVATFIATPSLDGSCVFRSRTPETIAVDRNWVALGHEVALNFGAVSFAVEIGLISLAIIFLNHLVAVVLVERNSFLAANICCAARSYPEEACLVAVLGFSHVNAVASALNELNAASASRNR